MKSVFYGRVEQGKSVDKNLTELIDKFGANNKHLANKSAMESQRWLKWQNNDQRVYLQAARVAQLVSNCNTQSDREGLVQSLQEHINVDVYGDCGSLECDPGTPEECYQMINQSYKFYLSLENSVCQRGEVTLIVDSEIQMTPLFFIFLCMEATYHEFACFEISKVRFNQSEYSILRISTNEIAPLSVGLVTLHTGNALQYLCLRTM